MLSPCFGCDPHFAAAVVCYLSFFLSGCSLFLYWYWLANYRDEVNPLGSRYPDPENSDCDTLDPEPLDEVDTILPPPNSPDTDDIHNKEIPNSIQISSSPKAQSSRSSQDLQNSPEIISSDLLSKSVPPDPDITPLDPSNQVQGSPKHACSQELPSGNANIDNSVDNVDGIESINSIESIDSIDSIGSCGDVECDCEDPEGPERKFIVSDNPYLNGDTYKQNLLWGLHGIFTNLFEAVLAAIFYSGLFENKLWTTLVWVIGFSFNFIVGNLLYVLLLLYCTNKSKGKELRGRWALESLFNVGKDLYYIWVGVAFLNHLVLKMKAQ